MFVYTMGIIAFVGVFCIIKEIIYPYKPKIEYVRKNRPQNYDWVSGRDYGGVILDDKKET
jgi:hypothetical protein